MFGFECLNIQMINKIVFDTVWFGFKDQKSKLRKKWYFFSNATVFGPIIVLMVKLPISCISRKSEIER